MSEGVWVVSCRTSDVFGHLSELLILIHFLPRVCVRPAETSAKLRTRVKIGKQEIFLIDINFFLPKYLFSTVHLNYNCILHEYWPLIGHKTLILASDWSRELSTGLWLDNFRGLCISSDSGPACECRNIDWRGKFCEIGKNKIVKQKYFYCKASKRYF